MSSIAATGSRFSAALRRELSPGVPDLTQPWTSHKAVPPASMGLKRPEAPSGEVNRTGAQEPGLPGTIDGPQDLAVMTTAYGLLDIWQNLLQGVSVTPLEPASGINQIEFWQSTDVLTSFEAVYALPPTTRGRLYGVMVDSVTQDIGQNVGIAARMALRALHGTRLDHPVEDAGNTGTYQAGPVVRGPMAREPKAPIHIEVSQDVAGGGLQYKAEQTPEPPTFPGAAIDVPYDFKGQAVWHNLQVALRLSGTVTIVAAATAVVGDETRFTRELKVGQYLTVAGESHRITAIADDTNLTLGTAHVAGAAAGSAAHILNRDAGFFGENYDPLEILFPGDATDHGSVDVGDMWTIAEPEGWEEPLPTFISPSYRYTSANLTVDYRFVGETVWRTMSIQGGQVVISWPTTVDPGNGRYPTALDRDGQSAITLSLPRVLRDTILIDAEESHRRLEMRLRLEGEQLGMGVYRESVIYEFGYVAIADVTRPIAGAGKVIEATNYVAESNPETGDSPVRIKVITDHTWTPAPAA